MEKVKKSDIEGFLPGLGAAALVTLFTAACAGPRRPPVDDEPLPYRYFLVDQAGAPGLVPGFAVAIIDEELRPGGIRYGRTRGGKWVAMSRLRPAPTTALRGAEVDGVLDFAWVVEGEVALLDRPAPGARTVGRHHRFDRVAIVPGAPGGWVRMATGGYLPAAALRIPRITVRPPEVGSGERWIDLDRSTQTLVAYAGDRPCFAALVSTGRPGRGTPPGRHRIRAKLRTADMDNLEQPAPGAAPYSVEAVPWVQYFTPQVAIHGAFWHQAFGQVHSHGCVNLAPADARWLFRFTAPTVRPGEIEAQGPGTLVQVR